MSISLVLLSCMGYKLEKKKAPKMQNWYGRFLAQK